MQQATQSAGMPVAAAVREPRPRARERAAWPRAVLLAAIGAGCGASAFVEGFYDLTAWGPIAVGLLGVLLGLVLGAPAWPRGAAAAALGALLVLVAWSWVSASWAESDDQAMEVAGRWALYASLLGVLLLLLRRRRDYLALLPFLCAGVLAVAVYVAIKMATGGGASLFVSGRLVEPLGYVNGESGLFVVGLWPLIAVAEQTRSRVLAGLGMAGAFIVAAMLVLGQARGALVGVVVSAAVVLAVVPGRARRLSALIVIGTALALTWGQLADIIGHTPAGARVPAESRIVEHAGELILVVAPVVGLVWGAGQALLGWVSGIGPRTRPLVPRVEGAVGVVLVALAGALALVSTHDPVGKVEHEYDQFVNLRVSQTEDSRLFSGGGYRHEYWRVAWNAFRDRPLRGLGAGNYDLAYLRERRIGESIRQPHSLELQTLAELGVVGGAAVIAFVIAVLAGLGRAARSAREDRLIRLVAVGAGGAFIAWLGHTSVEWLHYIPGVTGVALCGAAMLLAPWMKPVRKRLRHPTRAAMTVAAAVAVLVVGAVLGRTAAAEHMRLEGREELRSDAIQALRLADQSLALNDNALPSLYLKSAAYARLNRYREARAALLDATRLEPHDPVPWGLLGDLAVRRGDLSHARRSYRRASQLSPRDAILKKLASDPRVARQRLEEPRGGG